MRYMGEKKGGTGGRADEWTDGGTTLQMDVEEEGKYVSEASRGREIGKNRRGAGLKGPTLSHVTGGTVSSKAGLSVWMQLDRERPASSSLHCSSSSHPSDSASHWTG